MKVRVWTAALLLSVGAGTCAWAQYMRELKGKYYHEMTCPLLRNMKLDDLQLVQTARAAAMGGHEPCPYCKPPAVGARRRAILLSPQIYFIADVKSGVYHRPECQLVAGIARTDQRALRSLKDVRASDCKPCPGCKPPTLEALAGTPEEAADVDDREGADARTPQQVVKARLELINEVDVPGNQPSVGTKVAIAKGQIVMFNAMGRVQTSDTVVEGQPPPVWGPDGTVVKGKPKYCLAARVGDEVVVIGRTRGVRFQGSGELRLGFVDDADGYADNRGAFKVKLWVFTPESKPEPVGGAKDKP